MSRLLSLSRIAPALLFLLALFQPDHHTYAQTISPHLFGQNAWMPDTVGSSVLYGKLHANWGKIAASGAKIVRFGGISADNSKPTNYQYIKMIDSIRAKGMEPIIQVSYHAGSYSASQAAQVVQYINGTMSRNVKYWSIGNEPDLGYSYTTASQIAAYYKPFASAMKAADPTIKILGPETAWYDESIINGLTTPGGPYDITGVDNNGRYYVDIISFHTYPFSGSQTRANLVSNLTSSTGLDHNLSLLSARIASCNTAHNRTGSRALKTAITELNVGYQNASTDNVSGTGVNSFIGAQFLAEMFGIGMKNSVDIMTMWSVIEGNSTVLDIGYLDRVTAAKKPVYHHYKMLTEHFSGNYLGSVSTQTNVKVISCQNSSLTTVMVMNEDLTNNFGCAIRLDNSSISGSSPLKINVNGNIAQTYTDVIPNQSTMLFQFNNQGAIVKKVSYSIGQALAGGSPSVTLYSSVSIPSVAQPASNTPSANLMVCSGNTTTLSAVSGTNTIKWYASATSTAAVGTGSAFTTPALSVSASASTVTYYAEASNTSTASARLPLTVTVNPRPVITVNSGSICPGSSFIMSPSGAASYTFSGGSATVSPSTNASYSVTGTSAMGCTSGTAAIANVAISAQPVINVNSGTVCAGGVFTLMPSGGSSYTFSSGSATVSPVANTSYTVRGITSGCSGTAQAVANVSVIAGPVVSVNSGSVCSGKSFTLTPSGASSYTYSSGSPVVSPVANATYSVWGSNGSCVGNPALAMVTILTGTACSSTGTTGSTGTTVTTGTTGSTGTTVTTGTTASTGTTVTTGTSGTTTGTTVTTGTTGTTGTSGTVTTTGGTTTTSGQADSTATGVAKAPAIVQQISLYPNPNNGEFYIVMDREGTLTIASISGYVIRKTWISAGTTHVSITEVPEGIYLVSFTDGHTIWSGKVIRR